MNTRPALLALLGAPLALTLVACGGGSDDSGGDAGTPSAAGSASASSSADAGTTPAPAATAPTTPTTPSAPAASAGSDDSALLAAAATGLGAVDGVVFTVDRDNGGWEVTVVAADGTESDLTTDAAGTAITRDPVVDRDDADDTSDLAERRQLLTDATVGYEDALAAARAEVPGLAVDGIDLDLDRGLAVWEVSLGEDTADEQTVVVDATSGAVVRVELDD